MGPTITRNLQIYVTQKGQKPFIEWLEHLDKKVRYRVKERLDHIALGNLGDYKSIGEGLYELRLHFGAGYRIYFGQVGKTIVLLLSGGDKSTQVKDIKKAKQYWQDYLAR